MAESAKIGPPAMPPGVVETVPAFRSLLVVYDPVTTGRRAVQAAVEAELAGAEGVAATGALWRLPVCYDPDLGPDLEETATALRLEVDWLVALHGSAEYFVYMLGFMPGFGYMGDLPAALERPRRAEPRVRVPAG